MYVYSKYSIYVLYLSVFTTGRVICYIGWVVYPLSPRKYTVLNGNFVFDLRDVFQDCNPSIKWGLSVHVFEFLFLGLVLIWLIYYTDNIYKMYKDKLQNCSCNQFHYIGTYKQVKKNSMVKNGGGNNGSEKWIEINTAATDRLIEAVHGSYVCMGCVR